MVVRCMRAAFLGDGELLARVTWREFPFLLKAGMKKKKSRAGCAKPGAKPRFWH